MEARQYFKELQESVLKTHEEAARKKGGYFMLASKMKNMLSLEERLILRGIDKAPRKRFVNYGDNGK